VAAHNNDYFSDLLEISFTPGHSATARPFVAGADDEKGPSFSSDGRWYRSSPRCGQAANT
jgi:hypothetical protein